MYQIWVLLLLGGFVGPGVRRVGGITIYTPKELEVANGTDVRLKCTFTSTQPVSLQSVVVSWSFKPLNSGRDESVFYFQETAYPPPQGRFHGHAEWSGDVLKRDASITLKNVPPTFNGTYICQVRNRPDVQGSNGEIMLKVVNKVSLSEISILAAAIGGACGIILVLLGIFVAVRYCRRKRMNNDIELHSQEHEWKDDAMCSPEEAVPLAVVELKEKKKEVDSSDDEESEASSGGGGEEEEDGEEDDDDDDDDDDYGGDDDDD